MDVEETAGKIMNDNMGDSEFYQFLLAALADATTLADDGSICIFHADTEGLARNFRKSGCRVLPVRVLYLEEECAGAGP